MATRRVWSALSSSYQTRLLRAGITQEAYESGISLKKARGHAHTPEHPSDVMGKKKKQIKYARYINNLKSLQQQVIERKEQVWSNRFKYNDKRARQNVMRGVPPDFSKPGIVTLRRMLAASDQEWELHVVQAGHNANQNVKDDWEALLYH